MSLKGIFSGRDLLSFYCKKLFIAAWLLREAQTRHSPRTSWGGSGCIFQLRSLHPPSAVPPRTRTFFRNRNNKHALSASNPNSRTGSSPDPETQSPAHGAGRRPGRLGGRRRPRRPGRARAETEARSAAGTAGAGARGAAGWGRGARGGRDASPGDRPTPPPLRTCVGVPRRSPCPHNRVRPTYLTPRAGRRAGGRKEGRAAAGQPGVGGGFGPHLARPPRTTRRELGFRPDALPKSPRRR